MDTLVKTSVSLVILFAVISIDQSRPVCRQSYILQKYSYTSGDQCVVSPAFCRNINTLVETSVSLLLFFIEILIHQSRPVYLKSYFMQEYGYTGQDQCVFSHTFCSNINRLVETSVSLVLLFLEIFIYQSRPVCRQCYFLQKNRYTSRDQCVVTPTFYRNIDTLVKASVSKVETSVPLILIS